jgi:hypothetical protein
MSKPRAQILLEQYWDECNNQANFELIREVCGDPITRHDPGKIQTLSHDEQIARVKFGVEEMGVWIDHVLVHANNELVTSIWNMTMRKKDDVKMCGIEVFQVVDDRLAHCWNTPYGEGHWG